MIIVVWVSNILVWLLIPVSSKLLGTACTCVSTSFSPTASRQPFRSCCILPSGAGLYRNSTPGSWQRLIYRVQLYPFKESSSSSSSSFSSSEATVSLPVGVETEGGRGFLRKLGTSVRFRKLTPLVVLCIPVPNILSSRWICSFRVQIMLSYTFVFSYLHFTCALNSLKPPESNQLLSFLILLSVWRLLGSGLLHWTLVPLTSPMLFSWLSE